MVLLLLASTQAAKLEKYDPREALFQYTYGDSVVSNEYLQDTPSGYNVEGFLQLDNSRNHFSKKTMRHRAQDWDEDGEGAMNEGDYKGDSPPGYDVEAQVRKGSRQARRHFTEPPQQHAFHKRSHMRREEPPKHQHSRIPKTSALRKHKTLKADDFEGSENVQLYSSTPQ